MADWNKIKTEYVTSKISLRALAKKYDVSFNTLGKKAVNEKWKEYRQQTGNKQATKTIEKVTTKKAEQQAKEILSIENITIELLKKVAEAIPELNLYAVKDEHNEIKTEKGFISVKDLKALTETTKLIKDLKHDDSEIEKLDEILAKIGGVI